MKTTIRILSLLTLCATLAVTGCKTAPGPLSKAAVTGAVSAAVSFGLEQYPAAEPEVRIAESVICAAANSTNVAPAQVVAALSNIGITNQTSKLIVNSVLAVYNGVFAAFGSDWVQNQVALQGYLQAVCSGMADALPPVPVDVTRKSLRPLPPHLK